MKILHIVPGTGDAANGMVRVARLLAAEQNLKGGASESARNFGGLSPKAGGLSPVKAEIIDLFDAKRAQIDEADVIWVHGLWLPREWRVCWWALRARKKLVRMTHGCLDPVRLGFHGWRKRLVGPVERWILRRCERIVATCEEEKAWIEEYVGVDCPEIEICDLKRFFKIGGALGWRQDAGLGLEIEGLSSTEKTRSLLQNRQCHSDASGCGRDASYAFKPSLSHSPTSCSPALNAQGSDSPAIGAGELSEGALHVLYLGRKHPLKGVEYLEKAVEELKGEGLKLELRIVSEARGEELERVWEWCDVLCLPTLSENFGLVVAEALERGKRVIVTDGAPAWKELGGAAGVYLKGFRGGSEEKRVKLIKEALLFGEFLV